MYSAARTSRAPARAGADADRGPGTRGTSEPNSTAANSTDNTTAGPDQSGDSFDAVLHRANMALTGIGAQIPPAIEK
jgi:hypothetical protein